MFEEEEEGTNTNSVGFSREQLSEMIKPGSMVYSTLRSKPKGFSTVKEGMMNGTEQRTDCAHEGVGVDTHTAPDTSMQRLIAAAAELGLQGRVQIAWQTDPDGSRMVGLAVLARGVELEASEGWYWEVMETL